MDDSAPDRRMHDKVREAFTEACALIEPMKAAIKQGYVTDFALTHIVHDHFPHLTLSEVEVLVMAVKQYEARAV